MKGLIDYYGLGDWWASALTAAERERLETVFRPLGSASPRPLTEGTIERIDGPTATPAAFLSQLIGWLRATTADNATRRKMRAKLAELTAVEAGAIARHFSLQVLIKEFYRDRDEDPSSRRAAIQACRDQIAIAPAVATALQREFPSGLPRHVGYEQLAIILEKDGAYSDVIAFCEQARAAGWAGAWSKRIARCAKRLGTVSTKERNT